MRDPGNDIQVAVIAETRSRAKTLGMGDCFGDWLDMRCRQVKSPIPIEGPERIIEDIQESLWYGFRWNDDTMADTFPGWYRCWLYEGEP